MTIFLSRGGFSFGSVAHLADSGFSKRRLVSMSLKTQILIYIIVLAAFDTIIPIPITALVLIHVLYQKPRWFKEWFEEVYRP